jgi:hypothetical protein
MLGVLGGRFVAFDFIGLSFACTSSGRVLVVAVLGFAFAVVFFAVGFFAVVVFFAAGFLAVVGFFVIFAMIIFSLKWVLVFVVSE